MTLYSDRLGGEVFAGRNAIINGNFLFWQRGTTFNPISNDYCSDRWKASGATDGSIRIDRETTIKPNDDVNYTLKVTVLTADTSLTTTQYVNIFQRIEGYNYLPFIGKTATLSFWVRSSVTGIYSVSFRNGAPYDRSYVAEYTIDNANTWEYKTITVKFDYTGGTWNTTSGVGLDMMFSLALGPTYAGTPGSWLSGNYIGSTNQVNWMATAGNTFYLSNVQLELGSSAGTFENIPSATQLIQCLRYYEAKYYYANCVCTSTGIGYNYNQLLYYNKRAAPTTTYDFAGATIWDRVAWYSPTAIYPYSSWQDRMYFRMDDTAHSYNYGAALVRVTFYMDAEL